jgi:hypothetical protein
MKACITICSSLFVISLACGQVSPKEGFVPDSDTAIKIAEAVLVPVYGKTKVDSEKPFTAGLKGNVWIVSGTLHCPNEIAGTIVCKGGVAEIEISKSDARVLSMGHGK